LLDIKPLAKVFENKKVLQVQHLFKI